jgi:hypothetical protein
MRHLSCCHVCVLACCALSGQGPFVPGADGREDENRMRFGRQISWADSSPIGFFGLVIWTCAACKEHPFERTDVCVPSCAEATCQESIACTTNDECPLSTACSPEGACRPKAREFPSSTELVRGFETDEIQLRRGESAEFEIEAPLSARFVSCALFIGAPIFRDQSLVNVGACVARERVFSLDKDRSESSELSLRLDDLEPSSPEACPLDSALKAPLSGFRVVESLHLGCWAMDLEGIIGASRLLHIDPSELPEFVAAPRRSCDQSEVPTDGSPCRLPSPIGICRQRRCVAVSSQVQAAALGETARVCLDSEEGGACPLNSPGVGRCYAGNCLDQSTIAPLVTPLVTSDCDESDWENCFPSPLGIMGTCFSGLCRRRCHDGPDCDAGDECRRPAASYLGACTSVQEMTP